MPFSQSRSRRSQSRSWRFPIPPPTFQLGRQRLCQFLPLRSGGCAAPFPPRLFSIPDPPAFRPGGCFFQSRPSLLSAPAAAFYSPAHPCFPLRMGNDSAAAARRVSPHGTPKPFSPAQAAAPWAGCERARGHRLLPCAGGGPTRHTQTRPPVRPCGSGQAPKTRPPSAGGRLLYVSCGSRQKALPPRDGGRRAPPLGPSSSSPLRSGGPTRHTQTRPPSAGGRLLYVSCGSRQKALPLRDGVRRAPPLGPSSSSPLRSGGPAGRFRPASGPNWNRFRVKIFVFAPAGLDGIPAKWYRMILVGGWRIAVHAAGRIHSPAAHAANPSFSAAPRNKYAPAGRHTRAAFAPQRNVRWEELHCRTFWICSPT